MISVSAGLASAFFLWALNAVTLWRQTHSSVVWVMPVAGAFMGWLYATKSKAAQAAMTKILSDLADPQRGGISWVIFPSVLFCTLLTHLVGASAGREGTAVQMGSSIAATWSDQVGLSRSARRTLLTAGIAAGFASVFGTPLAAAVYALELPRPGKIAFKRCLVALSAAFAADFAARLVGARHSYFPAILQTERGIMVWVRLALLAACVAAMVRVYIALSEWTKALFARHLKHEWTRPFVGALLLIVGWRLVGDRFLGLGVPTIELSFLRSASIQHWWPWAKLLFTAVTIGAGFVGGEVTPLFFVGATFGASFAPLLHLDPITGAAVAMVAMFGAAANTPLAMAVMCGELFGFSVFLQALWVCMWAFALSSPQGIYKPQPSTPFKLESWVRRTQT